MTTHSSRFRFVLVDEGEQLPVLYRQRAQSSFAPDPPRSFGALTALIEAFAQLGRRGPGTTGWAMPLSENPLSFLLDSMNDAVFVRQRGGQVVYRNRAATALPVLDRPPASAERVFIGPHCYERRCLTIEDAPVQLIIEVLSATGQEGRS
jgi:PAS domain-containing protein